MAYITLDEAKQFLSTIYVSAYQNENTDIPDDSILQEDIDAMTALIDSYIKRSYDQVIAGVSSLALLKSYAQALILRKAYSRFDNAQVPESVQTDNNDTILRLKDLATGVSFLPDEDQVPRDGSISYQYNEGRYTNGGEKVFTRENMSGY